jgi:hypothetical protein
MNHYRIYYLNRNGKETLPDMAVNFRVFVNGEYVKDFFPLSAANSWIADQRNRELFPLCAARLDAFEKEEAAKNLLTLETSP